VIYYAVAQILGFAAEWMMIMKRIMGLDYGSLTVGVAISDTLLLTAQGIEVIRRKQENKLRQTLARIEELIAQYDVDTIILGYPKHLNNTVGERAKKSEEFADKLRQRTGLNVILWDERLTTVAAHQVLDQGGLDYREKAMVVDKVAAVFILQSYLDRLHFMQKNTADE
jgi:putative Holliday junction resolvase